MLNEKSVTVAIHDELVSIRQRLMEKDYSQLESISIALEFIEDVLVESHPSGYPDPIFLGCIASLLRDEKFRDRRENQCTTPLSTDIQTLIDRLKKLRTQAEAARPQKMRKFNWVERDWGVSLEGIVFWIFWLCLQIFIIGFSYFILPSPGSCINYLTVANAVLLLFSVLCKSYIGLTITSAQIVMHFISLAINHLMHH